VVVGQPHRKLSCNQQLLEAVIVWFPERETLEVDDAADQGAVRVDDLA
jgi:hypothetical protein